MAYDPEVQGELPGNLSRGAGRILGIMTGHRVLGVACCDTRTLTFRDVLSMSDDLGLMRQSVEGVCGRRDKSNKDVIGSRGVLWSYTS